MIFSRVIGNSFSRSFIINSPHSYVQVKFNAVILNSKQDQVLTVTVYAEQNALLFTKSKLINRPPLNRD